MERKSKTIPFKLRSPIRRDTSLTGGREEHLLRGGRVHVVSNPQYVPGRQYGKINSKRNGSRHIVRGSGRTHRSFS